MARHERVRLFRRRAWATAYPPLRLGTLQHVDPQPYEPHDLTQPKHAAKNEPELAEPREKRYDGRYTNHYAKVVQCLRKPS